MSIWALIKAGGWVMVPLIALSVVAWAVCVERLWSFRGWSEKNREFLLSFQNHWLRGDRDSAAKLCERADVVLAELARELLILMPNEPLNDRVRLRVDRRRVEQAAGFRRGLWLLGTIGSATPFVGLFGTVIGIIKAFQSMAESGAGGFTVVAAGISEALVATAGGIIVAVIAVFFYNYFQVRVGQLQFQLKLLTEELLEGFDAAGSSVKSANV